MDSFFLQITRHKIPACTCIWTFYVIILILKLTELVNCVRQHTSNGVGEGIISKPLMSSFSLNKAAKDH